MDIRNNQLVRMADEAKRPSSWWLAWIMAAIIIVVGGAVGMGIGEAVFGDDPASVMYQYGELFIFGLTLLGLFLWVRFKEGRSILSVGLRGAGALRKFVVGLVIGAAMMAVPVILLMVTGTYESGGSEHTESGSAALLLLVPLLVVFAVQGTTEEAVTRGYMLQMGGRQLPGWVAVLASSIFFALIHVAFEPVILLNLTLYAVFASFVALQQGSLWLISGIHAGWNFVQGNVLGLPVSGTAKGVSLFGLGPAEGSSDLVSGGDYGLEASIVGSVVLIVATIVAWRAFSARRPAEEDVVEPTPA